MPDPRDFLPPPPWEAIPMLRLIAAEIFLDPEIADFVFLLNAWGYETISSCAGHPGHRYYNIGWVYFSRILSPEEIEKVKELASKYGLTGLQVESPRRPFNYTAIYFDPIG